LAMVSLVVGPQFARAQDSRATLGGRIIDAQGAVVPNAHVIVSSGETGVKHDAKSNDQGNWAVRFLIPGRYSFTVSAPGFKQVDRDGITLQTSDIKLIDVRLEIGAATSQITVTAEAG